MEDSLSSPVQQYPISFEDELESLFDFKACAEMLHEKNKNCWITALTKMVLIPKYNAMWIWMWRLFIKLLF